MIGETQNGTGTGPASSNSTKDKRDGRQETDDQPSEQTAEQSSSPMKDYPEGVKVRIAKRDAAIRWGYDETFDSELRKSILREEAIIQDVMWGNKPKWMDAPMKDAPFVTGEAVSTDGSASTWIIGAFSLRQWVRALVFGYL